ncbi:MAG: M23 family metallopeptidase [Candidatus Aenigmatarchaeota archaeon]
MSKCKGLADTFMLVIVAAVLLATFFIFIQINNFIGIAKIKGEVNVYYDVQDRGTQMLSLMKAQKSGQTYMSMLGSYAATGVPSGYETELMTTLQKLGEYDLFVQTQSNDILKEFKSSSPPSGLGYVDKGIQLNWPVKNYNTISSGYGMRDLKSSSDMHGGIDFAVAEEKVYSAYPTGKVVRMGKGCEPSPDRCVNVNSCSVSSDKYCCCNSGLGNFIVIEHVINGQKLYTHYDHLKEIYVKVNDELGKDIKAGEPIGLSGTTGFSTGNHLHFELNRDSLKADKTSVNPCPYFPDPVPVNCEQESHRSAGLTVTIPLPNGQVGSVGLII